MHTASYSFATLLTSQGSSDYNALQIQFQRRLSHGIQALASYSWSHSIDTGSAGSNALTSNLLVPFATNGNRGPSDFDVRSAFSAGITWDLAAPHFTPSINKALRASSTHSLAPIP